MMIQTLVNYINGDYKVIHCTGNTLDLSLLGTHFDFGQITGYRESKRALSSEI